MKITVLLKSKPSPPKVNSVPASPWVSTSAPIMPAHTQTVLREAISSSPVQTQKPRLSHHRKQTWPVHHWTLTQQMGMVSWHSLQKVFGNALQLTYAWNKIHGWSPMRCSILESPMLLCYCSRFWLSNYEKVFMQEKKAYRDKQGHLMTLRLDLTKCSLRVCCLHNAVCTKQMAKSTLRIIFTTCMDIQWPSIAWCPWLQKSVTRHHHIRVI